jgi:hypothetical protein
MSKLDSETREVYICSTAFDYDNTFSVYESLEALKNSITCVNDDSDLSCGIYKVEMKIIEVVKKPLY